MFKKMIVKEWKEKSGLFLFALAGLVLFALAFYGYSKDKNTLDILVSTLLLIFLPVFSLLLGASGFSSEFQDGAWAYLFSRPVKKWRVWLAKYFSLLTILLVVIILFALLTQLHPALKPAPDMFNFPLLDEDISYGILVFVLPFLLFTTAFSLSILSEKTHAVAFLAALVWIVLQIAVTRAGFSLLERQGMYSSTFLLVSILSLLIPLSLAMASLVTLNRADFSQPKQRDWIFTKSAAVFILASIGLVALFALGTRMFQRDRYIYDLEARNNAFYFATDKGYFKFDVTGGQTEKLARHPSMWGYMSMAGDKVVFTSYDYGGGWRGFAQLRIMNNDGKEERRLVGTENQESPLYGGYIYPVRMSPRGDKVAFFVRYGPKATVQDLWVINSDGSGLKGYDLGIPDAEFYMIVGFGAPERSLFVLCTQKFKPGKKDRRAGARLLRVDLESGKVETLADQIRKPYVASMSRTGLTSEAGLIAYIHYDEVSPREILTVLDPETLEKHQVYPEDSVTGFRWNKAGDKLAFLTGKSMLGVYSAAERKIIRTKQLAGYDLRWPSQALEWATDDSIILRRIEQWKTSSICLLDANLIEQKAIRLPFSTHYASRIWSAGKYAFAENSEKYELWGLDLTTEKWVRIY
jgi:ABC-type transport system involved in multi-copper enzyme maturation permease subunit